MKSKKELLNLEKQKEKSQAKVGEFLLNLQTLRRQIHSEMDFHPMSRKPTPVSAAWRPSPRQSPKKTPKKGAIHKLRKFNEIILCTVRQINLNTLLVKYYNDYHDMQRCVRVGIGVTFF